MLRYFFPPLLEVFPSSPAERRFLATIGRSGPKLSIPEINGIIIITSLLFLLSETMRNRDRERERHLLYSEKKLIIGLASETEKGREPTRKEKKEGRGWLNENVASLASQRLNRNKINSPAKKG